jgi:hypothetical protein
MLPALGRRNPVTSFISDDLPQPDGPTTATNFPVDLEVEPFDGKRRASAAIHQPHITHLQQGAHRQRLPSRNVADDVERELALVAAPRPR